MMKVAIRTGSALALFLAAFAAPASAQVTPVPAPAAGTANQQQHWQAKQILGAKVSIQGNTGVGTVDDIILRDDGVVDYVVVNNDGKLFTVPWDAAKFNMQQRTAVIELTQQQFSTIPTYTTNQYPAFATPAYREQVYQFYNIRPGQERRLERRIERR